MHKLIFIPYICVSQLHFADFCWSQTNLSQYLVHPSHWTVVGNSGSCLKSNLPELAQLHPCLLSYIAAGYMQPLLQPTQYRGMERGVIFRVAIRDGWVFNKKSCGVKVTVLFFCQVQELFRVEYGEVFHIQVPTSRERRNFFEDLILNQAAKAPVSKKKAGEK